MRDSGALNVGLVGCGAIAPMHLRAIAGVSGLKLVAVCDTNEEVAATVARSWHASNFYSDFSDMLDQENLAIVAITTPVNTHVALSLRAIEKGVNVLVEKPLCESTDEAQKVLDLLKKQPTIKLTVNFNWLLGKAMMNALSFVKSEAAGDVLAVDIKITHTIEDKMSSDQNHWSHKLRGGRIAEMLAHPVYITQAALGDDLEVAGVIAEKRGPFPWMLSDELFLTLHGKSGIAQTYVSFNAPRPSVLIDFYCRNRILRVDLLNQTLLQLGHRTLSKFDSGLDCVHITSSMLWATLRNATAYAFRKPGDSLALAYHSLERSIRLNERPLVTPEMAFHNVRIVQEIEERLSG